MKRKWVVTWSIEICDIEADNKFEAEEIARDGMKKVNIIDLGDAMLKVIDCDPLSVEEQEDEDPGDAPCWNCGRTADKHVDSDFDEEGICVRALKLDRRVDP